MGKLRPRAYRTRTQILPGPPVTEAVTSQQISRRTTGVKAHLTHEHTRTHTGVWEHATCKGKLAVELAYPVLGQGLSGARTSAHNARGRGRRRTSPARPPGAGTPERLAWPIVLAEHRGRPSSLPSLPTAPHTWLLSTGWLRTALLLQGLRFSAELPASSQLGPAGCNAGLASSLLCSSGPCPQP